MFATAAGTSTATPIGTWLIVEERDHPVIDGTASLDTVLGLFERHAGLRLLPIVDSDGRPQGAIFDDDVRRLLMNPFGRALRQNPTYAGGVADLGRPAPMSDSARSVADVVDHYRRCRGTDGMILTHEGRFHAVITNARLIYLAAENELARERSMAARGQAIEAASIVFERQLARLIDDLNTMAHAVKQQADAAAIRSVDTGDHAASVAAGAIQGTTNLAEIEAHGAALGMAFTAINDSTHDAKMLAANAVSLVEVGTMRTDDLACSVESIEGVVQLIGGISRQVSLLSLNAGIEAARAGDAGRGFAVVAQEVKALSQRTAAAADKVVHHITDIQTAVLAVAEVHHSVAGKIREIDTRSGTIRTAVAEQASFALTMARNVGEAANAAGEIQNNAGIIAANARLAADNATTMRNLAIRFLQGAEGLTCEASRFLNQIRAC